jgi:tRNA (guanine37-N1)-methyltransferase
MNFNIFTLHPDIFESFTSNALIARSLSQNIIDMTTINWRDDFGVGNYNQVDDKPYGGGSGMVLQADPIFNALKKNDAVSPLYKSTENSGLYNKVFPNNFDFYAYKKLNPNHRNITISLTPRGHRYTQKVAEWLVDGFDTINLVCGRYEGFDARVDSCFDLELSLGDFVLNGGEVAAMCMIESIARLVPGFVTKDTSVMHDSFSSRQNYYDEQHEYIIGKHNLKKKVKIELGTVEENIFDNQKWLAEIAPQIEHPQFTRPEIWQGQAIPQVLLEGNHKLIQEYRTNWLKNK